MIRMGFLRSWNTLEAKKVGDKVVGGYVEIQKYMETQPLDKRTKNFGFGSHDASKTDEFCNTIRTEQYRGTLRKEMEVMNKSAAEKREELQELINSHNSNSPKYDFTGTTNDRSDYSYDSQVPQYDIGRTRESAFNPKAGRDTYYRFSNTRERRFGMSKPVSTEVGDEAWNITYKPPAHGGKSEVKNFWDKSHMQIRY